MGRTANASPKNQMIYRSPKNIDAEHLSETPNENKIRVYNLHNKLFQMHTDITNS